MLKINRKISEWLLFCVRMMSPLLRALSTMMLCLLKLMKHRVIWSLLLYWRHSTWLSKLHFQKIQWDGNAWCLQSKVKAHFSCVSVSYSRYISSLPQMPLAVVVHIIWRCFSSCMQYGDWKWLKNTLGTACYMSFVWIFLLTTSIYTFLSVCGCVCIQKTSYLGTQANGQLHHCFYDVNT